MPNRLAQETSPYLRQHADNPVDWYPWGEEALAEAKRTGKPILLSVGYSACHWCHVMAHESFEDPAIAAVMNELFVNVKVDREERPDIDQVYQAAQSMLTQRPGGWPLTMFLTPDQVPFFGGTYFPPEPRHGMPGFADLVRRVREYHDRNPGDLRETGAQLAAAFARMEPRPAAGDARLDRQPLEEAAATLVAHMDPVQGGFPGAPKFPHAETIELLLRRHAFTGEPGPLAMATLTLRRMAEGGIFDHVGGGFARYSTDERWAIPHFEKMLYDNGWLLRLYADAWAATRDPLFRRTAEATAGWVLREMQSPGGGYYSSLDADSEGEEGRFYVWDREEVRSLLAPEEYAAASAAFGLAGPPNFEGRHWHLVRTEATVDERLLESARAKLHAARERRVRPGRDDKVLTSWNALMVGGMARAARVFGRREWLDSARRALGFLRSTMWQAAGARLLATAKDGRAHLDAYLDDHAYLLAALLEVMQAEFHAADLRFATEVADALIDRFEDREVGGFWFTAHDHEALIHRQKPGPDNATPSGNGVAAWALQRLAFLTGDERYSRAALRTLELFRPRMEAQPVGFASLLMALEEHLAPPRTVILTGPGDAFGEWREMLDPAYLPATMVLALATGTEGLPPVLAKPASGTVNAWVCEGVTCLPPEPSLAKLRDGLELPRMRPSDPPTAPLRSSR